MNLLVPILPQQLSFSKSLSTSQCSFFHKNSKNLLLCEKFTHFSTVIRMGGGPRTYPGGVSKWQWKRMQAKKAKQLLKARLCRERQMYEMRKRAELKAAVSELERPWEVVEKAPNLFSVSADEQLKVLADRFQMPGGFDLWSEKDGPQLFKTPDELPSARFFPKGVVHSIKPYRRVGSDELGEVDDGFEDGSDLDSGVSFNGYLSRKGDGRRLLSKGVNGSESDDVECSSSALKSGRKGMDFDANLSKKDNGRRILLEDVDGSESDDDEHFSSASNSGRKRTDFDGNLSRKRNGSRFLSEDDDGSEYDGECSSALYSGRNRMNVNGRMRKNGNGSKYIAKGVDGSQSDDGEYSSYPLNSGRNGASVDGRMRRNGNGRKYFAKGVDRSEDGERSSPSLGSGRNGAHFEGRMRNKGSERRIASKGVDRSEDNRLRGKENGRRFMSKDVDGSNRSYSGGVRSVRRLQGSSSISGRGGGKFTRRNSDHASDSEVYEMGLQQDGSYGFLEKSEQSYSTNW